MKKIILIISIAFCSLILSLIVIRSYEHIFSRPIVSLYPGFGRDSVRFVLYYVKTNDLELCHYKLFSKTNKKNYRTHENAMAIASIRAREGDRLLVPFIYEYAQDISWDKPLRKTAIMHLITMNGTQELAIVKKIANASNDPLSFFAASLITNQSKNTLDK